MFRVLVDTNPANDSIHCTSNPNPSVAISDRRCQLKELRGEISTSGNSSFVSIGCIPDPLYNISPIDYRLCLGRADAPSFIFHFVGLGCTRHTLMLQSAESLFE